MLIRYSYHLFNMRLYFDGSFFIPDIDSLCFLSFFVFFFLFLTWTIFWGFIIFKNKLFNFSDFSYKFTFLFFLLPSFILMCYFISPFYIDFLLEILYFKYWNQSSKFTYKYFFSYIALVETIFSFPLQILPYPYIIYVLRK